MKTNLTIFLILIVAFNIQAQNDSGNFRLHVFVSYDDRLSSRNIGTEKWVSIAAEGDNINYKVGFNIEYEFKTNTMIISGINYSNKNFTSQFWFKDDILLAFRGPYIIELNFIEIPVKFRHYFLQKKFKLFGEIGLNNQIQLTANKIRYYDKLRSLDNNTFSIGGIAGCGVEYNFNPKIAIQLFSNYNKGISNYYKNSNYKIDYLSIGAGIMIAI